MRKIFISFILLCQLVSASIFAQEIDRKVLNKIINNQFSFITTGQAKSSLSNFVSYDAKDSQVSFNGVLPIGKKSLKDYISINANGAISDGIFAVFNNSKINSNTALELKVHLLDKKNWDISYSQNDKKEYLGKINILEREYNIKKDSVFLIYQSNKEEVVDLKRKVDSLIKIRENFLNRDSVIIFQEDIQREQRNKNFNIKKLENEEKQIKKDEKQIKIYKEIIEARKKKIEELRSKIDFLKNNCKECFIFTGVPEKDYPDSIKVNVSPSLYVVDSLLLKYSKAFKKYPTEPNSTLINLRDQLNNLDEIKEGLKDEINDSFIIKQVKIRWSGISYKIYNNNFYLFDDKNAFDSQIIEKNFVGHEIAYELNFYRKSDFNNTRYSNFRVGFFLADNKDAELQTKEIIENKLYPKDSTLNRTSSKKYNAYVGDYKKDIFGMKLSVDHYCFLFKNNNGGIHIYPEAIFKSEYKPIYNFGIGMFLSFKNNTDIKSIVNAEFYFKLLDISSNNSFKSVIKGNEAGIRMSFPIKFIFK